MVKATFLLPRHDNEGVWFESDEFTWFQNQLIVRFAGWTREEGICGAWLDETDGQVFEDQHYRYTVYTKDLAGLESLLQDAKVRFRQRSIVIETAKSRVRFL